MRIRKGFLKGSPQAFILPDGFYVIQEPHESSPFCKGTWEGGVSDLSQGQGWDSVAPGLALWSIRR